MKANNKSAPFFHGLLLIFLLLLGCEAKLNLEGVNKELTKSIVRTDQFQEMVYRQNQIFLIGSQGVVLTSENRGIDWKRQIVPSRPNFISLAVCPDNALIALSYDHRLWKSVDNGKTWTDQPIPTEEDVVDLCCTPDGTYWIAGSFSTFLHSTDKGVSWQEHSLGEDAILTHIEFFDNKTGIAAGEFGLFFKTTDGGKNWESVGVIGDELYPLAVFFKDENNGWVGGLSGVIMKTTDGGVTWSSQTTEVESPIYDFIDGGRRLFAVGDQGSILVQQGDQWKKVKSPNIPVYLSTGHLFENNEIVVAGGWGTLFSVPVPIPEESIASSTELVQQHLSSSRGQYE